MNYLQLKIKNASMRTMYTCSRVLLVMLIAVACNSGAENKGGLAEKKAALQKLKNEQTSLGEKIKKLEEEIAKLDSNAGPKPKLVSVGILAPRNFTHYIDLRGKIDAEDISYIGPRGQGGTVKALYIKKGDYVKKGQLILKLEDAVLLQQLEQLKTQLAFAKDLYQRQKNLWDQGIGTEVQFITAKNNVESLERQIATTRELWTTTNVYSDVNGVADEVNIRVGEFFQGATAMGPQIKIVNTSSLKAVVDIPENYISQVKKGTKVIVEIPDLGKTINTTVSLVSQTINASSRGFTAEAKIPNDPSLKPNLLALFRIEDYSVANTMVVAITTIQTDSKGKYVYVLAEENGKKIARKRQIVTGSVYGEQIEVKEGLSSGDQLITRGFQDLYDGQLVTTEVK